MKKICFNFLALLAFLTSCENQEMEFPDFIYQSTYFAYQYPVRTITLGEDIFDTSLDNQGKFQIMATTGGVYDNKKDVTINVTVDNSLTTNLLFNANANEIKAMPSSYYTLASDKIVIPKGKLIGGVEVQLTDAFFADPLAIRTNYVIPMRMTSVVNADTILSGVPLVQNPNRVMPGDWSVRPKDFVLYAVKYINPWHGFYLRRGRDEVKGKNGNTSLDRTVVRQQQYVENDQVVSLITNSRNQAELTIEYIDRSTSPPQAIFKNSEGNAIPVKLILTFDNDGKITVSSNSTEYTVTGTGSFVKRGEKNSWGNLDRDAIYLTYTVNTSDMTITTTDTLVMRNRGVAMETFAPVLK